jgi:hypothetical protein
LGDLPQWVTLGAIPIIIYIMWEWRKASDARLDAVEIANQKVIADKDAQIRAKDERIEVLNEKLLSLYRENLPVLARAAEGLEAVAAVIPTLVAAEPRRIPPPGTAP